MFRKFVIQKLLFVLSSMGVLDCESDFYSASGLPELISALKRPSSFTGL